ncbi:helix-turn-helix domain-containing protein [Nostoc sp.]|uniref:helix-turn-helix domain-containing protein n=1 Tax=Nostoc sp. TaxID=1180 RepID=UPI002FF82441
MPNKRLQPVLDYIHSYLDRPLLLAELAEISGISQYYFCRLFKQSMGIAPYQYVLGQRMEKAKELLQQRKYAIALHQTVYGLLLVCAFSVGLAVVLVTIGLVIIYAHQWLKRFSWVQPLQQYTPIISAIAVIIGGSILMVCAVI